MRQSQQLPPRVRMVVTAALMIRERGVEATSLRDVVERSGAPRGSIYHHFPGGKAELVEAATRYAGAYTADGLSRALSGDDPLQAVRMFVDTWTELLQDSDYGEGCPVVAAAIEGNRTPGAREAAGAAFDVWQDLITAALADRLPHDRAASIATLIIAAVEGAVVLARAQRDVAPLHKVADELERVITAALGAA